MGNEQAKLSLLEAATDGDVAQLERILTKHPSHIDSIDHNGRTPMSAAAYNGHVSVIELLVRLGSKAIDTPDNDGCTPLFVAVWNGHVSAIETLVLLGSKAIDTPNNSAATPMRAAAYLGRDSVIETLVRLGSKAIDTLDYNGWTPLQTAATNLHAQCVKLFLQLGARQSEQLPAFAISKKKRLQIEEILRSLDEDETAEVRYPHNEQRVHRMQMARSLERGLVFLLFILFAEQALSIQLTKQTMQLKTGDMLGSVGISMAQWDLEFDQDLYYFQAPPCAPGLTRQNLTAAAVAADPCWAGCDFTSSDPQQCGQPFNTTDSRCQAICDNHPKKTTLCDYTNRPWYVIEPDVESPLFNIDIVENLHLRFNWFSIEQGFRYEGMPTLGTLSVGGVALMDYAAELDGGTYCFGKNSPDTYANTCPSFQCFYYGTWEIAIGITAQGTITNYNGISSHILRTFPHIGDVRRTTPRDDAPVTYDDTFSSLHTSLKFGVTVNAQFGDTDAAIFYQLTTPYCGFINILHEKAVWDRPVGRVVVGVSTDGNPFPYSIYTDILFTEEAIKPVWVCPRPPETNAVVFFAVLRYAASGEPDLSTPEMHYLTVDYYREEDQWKKYRLGSTPAESGYSNFTNFPPVTNWADGLAANLFRLSCPNPDDAATTDYIDCRAGSATVGTCFDFQFGVPLDPWTVSLLPVPAVVSALNPEGFGNIEYPAFQPTASNKLSAFLILELTSDGSVVSQTLGSDWENLWSQCVLHIGTDTPIASVDGDWFFADLALEQTVPECVFSEFEELAQLITENIESMASDPLTAYSKRLIIDELTFHDPWQACNAFIAAKLSTAYTANVSVFDSTACLDSSDSSDPCCNNDLSWTQCCASRNFVASVEALALDAAATNETCEYASCIEPLLSDYYTAQLDNTIGSCSGPDLNDRLRAPLRVYRDCRKAAFGDDFILPSCVVDSDCTSLVSNTALYCNQVTKQCAFSFTDSVTYFFECIADNLPIETRIKLIALNDFSISDGNTLAAQLLDQYGRTAECVDSSFGSPWSLHNAYMVTGSLYGGCPICERTATDVTYQPPPWCEARTDSKCIYAWYIWPNSVGCATQVCNWDQSDSCGTSLLGSSFCGVCESDAMCTQVSDVSSSTSCLDIPAVCFLADGTVRTDLTEAGCAEAYSCTLACAGGSCANQGECEGVGYCETDDEIYEAMAASSWNNATNDGFCAIPMKPYNSPDCSILHVGSLPTSYGCVVFGDCDGLAALLTCKPNYYTEKLCKNLTNGVWWPRNDKESCLSKQACHEQLVGIASLSSLGTRLRSPKTADECALCGGTMENVSSWVSGRWLPGTVRKAQWIERAMATRYETADSINFDTLSDDIYTAARAAVAFQLQNNIQCSYQTLLTLVSPISCACTTELSRERCFSGGYISSVGLGQVCPQTANTIVAPPSTLSYSETSVASELQDQCVEFTIDRINSRFFYGEAPPPISTGFVPEFNIRGWNSVVNQNGAMVGQVIGDGIQIKFTQNGKYLTELRVCLFITASIPLSETEPFTEYGLGYWTGGSSPATVVPDTTFTNVTVADGWLCASIQLDRTGEDASFVPIYFRQDWQEQPSTRFSSGQKALLYIVASFYAILCAILVVQMIRLIAVGAWDFQVGTNYMWVLLFFMIVIRAVYIYLVAADVLGQQSLHLLVDFWMMDLPTLLYLICNAIIALTFLFLLLASKDDKFQNKTYFWVTLVILVSFIVAIFVAILLAFNYAVVDTQGSHGPALCSTYTDNSSAATAIRIVYECLLFAIALAIALIGAIIAGRLWWDLRDQDGTSSLLMLGVVSSYGILSDSLAFLIYYIVNNPTPYFAIVLIFTEILPITFLVLRVSTKQIKNKQRSTDGTPKTKRGGSTTSSSL